jgi:hypothetical protein
MSKEQDFKNMATIISKEFDFKKIILADKYITGVEDGMLHAIEIYAPHPYSVFALCKLYEYFQRN